MPSEPTPPTVDADNGELEPDPSAPDGATPEHRATAELLEEHASEVTAPTDPG